MRAIGLLLLLLCGLSPARAESLITSLSNHRVLINSNYTGTQIAVFGAIERDAQTVARATAYDVVVTVRGPTASTKSACLKRATRRAALESVSE